jgi:ubiquinone/menaquinone biosynthesis C-methylase UbiE
MSANDPAEANRQKQQVLGVFDRAAPTYGQVGPQFFSHFGRRLVELAQIPPGTQVLDVATGRGALLFPAAQAVGKQGRVTGIDLSAAMVQETAQELASLGLAPVVELRQMDAERLEFPDAAFDGLLCGFALFFFPNLSQALSEFRRVLKPGGRLAVSTRSKVEDERWTWFEALLEAHLPPEPKPAAPPEPKPAAPDFGTPEGLQAMLSAAGFADIQVISETAEFSYASAEEYWATLWSHGARRSLEQVERVTGTEGLQRFKAAVLARAAGLHQSGGLRQAVTVLYTLATNMGS